MFDVERIRDKLHSQSLPEFHIWENRDLGWRVPCSKRKLDHLHPPVGALLIILHSFSYGSECSWYCSYFKIHCYFKTLHQYLVVFSFCWHTFPITMQIPCHLSTSGSSHDDCHFLSTRNTENKHLPSPIFCQHFIKFYASCWDFYCITFTHTQNNIHL